MSIATEITRLQTAKADLKTAIEGKGVTVSSSATLDDYADLVDAISGGGSGGTGYYHLTADTLYQLFDQYATENEMTKMDLSIASAPTDYFTVQHTLGKVPTEALLYPKNAVMSGSGYQMGWTINSLFGVDKTGNRTYLLTIPYAPNPNVVWYPSNKKIMTFISSIRIGDYNFSRNATSSQIDLRGGTNAYTKLLVGEYVLALK